MRTVNLTSIAKWGESLGITRQSANEAVKRCGIPLHDGKVDPEVATPLYRRHTRVRARQGSASAMPAAGEGAALGTGAKAPSFDADDVGGDDYWANRARRERAEAQLAELKLEEQRGDLVRVGDVRATFSRRVSALREGLMQIPARLASVLAAEGDADRCYGLLEAELRGVLLHVTAADEPQLAEAA